MKYKCAKCGDVIDGCKLQNTFYARLDVIVHICEECKYQEHCFICKKPFDEVYFYPRPKDYDETRGQLNVCDDCIKVIETHKPE